MTESKAADRLIVPIPVKGMCLVCFVKHSREAGHDTRSIVYQRRFRMANGYYPGGEKREEVNRDGLFQPGQNRQRGY